MEIINHGRNTHTLRVPGYEQKILWVSDVHFDSKGCDRDLLKSHFDKAKKEGYLICIIGDWYDLMQGRYDPRRSNQAQGMRDEYLNSGKEYLDAIQEDAINFLKPYVENILLIGLGNHECYRVGTEALTSEGWKRIEDVTCDDHIATFNESEVWYEQPLKTLTKEVDKIINIEGNYTSQSVSGKHAVVLKDLSKVNAEDLVGQSITEKEFPHGAKLEYGHYADPDLIKLITCVVMDGTIVDYTKYGQPKKKRIQFKISKPEKIAYIRRVLDDCNVNYTFKEATKTGLNKLQPYYIRIYGDDAREIFELLDGVKRLPEEFALLTGDEFEAFIDALSHTDGRMAYENTCEWSTTSKHDIDIVQRMTVHNGVHMSYKINEDGSGFPNGKRQYRARIALKLTKVNGLNITEELVENEKVYCLVMPSGRFITRYKGKVAYSGNTSVMKNCGTNMIERLVTMLNHLVPQDHPIIATGYTGWLRILFHQNDSKVKTFLVRYRHGDRGNAKRSKGILQVDLDAMQWPDADLIVKGDDHQKWHFPSVVRNRPNQVMEIVQDVQEHLRLGSYVNGLGDEFEGWAVEKGFSPTKLGGWFTKISFTGESRKNKKLEVTEAT